MLDSSLEKISDYYAYIHLLLPRNKLTLCLKYSIRQVKNELSSLIICIYILFTPLNLQFANFVEIICFTCNIFLHL